MKSQTNCSKSRNFFTFHSDYLSFTGTPKNFLLLSLRKKGQIKAVKEYLKHKNFEGFWINKNILNLGDLEIVQNSEHEISILFNREIDNRFKKDFLIEMSILHRLILFTIVTAEDNFSLDKLVEKINSADKKFEEFTLDELQHLQTIDKYQSC